VHSRQILRHPAPPGSGLSRLCSVASRTDVGAILVYNMSAANLPQKLCRSPIFVLFIMMGYLLPHPTVPIKLPSIRSLLLDLPEPITRSESDPYFHQVAPPQPPSKLPAGGTSAYQLPSPSTSPLDTNRLATLSRVSTSGISNKPPPLNFLLTESGNKRIKLLVLPKLEPSSNPDHYEQSSDSRSALPFTLGGEEAVGAADDETAAGSAHNECAVPDSDSRPRKKRQCPQCNLYFSNLATHKSTHLKPTSRPHVCKYCHRGFARPNDLFRHTKCHWKEIGSDRGQFKCPFKLALGESSSEDHCCHPLGIFSRCDTFKNHLKAIHFKYPAGTRKEQRSKVAGTCRLCQQQFANVDDWLTNHVEKGSCSFQLHHD
jgi:hypothetical protein